MSLVSVVKEECTLGAPLPWTVYDQAGNVLMEQGGILETEEQLEALLEAGPLRQPAWEPPSIEQQVEGPEITSSELDKALSEGAESTFGFHDMRLRVGDRLQIQPPANVGPQRYVVKLIGYLDNVTLLVTVPMDHGVRVQLRERDRIIARIFSSQKAFGFGTQVERICRIPFDYMHLAFPQQIQGSIIRSSPRVRTSIIVTVGRPDAAGVEQRHSGVIVNLSAEGALVKSRERLCEKGESLGLSFRVKLHNLDAHLSLKAVARSVFVDEVKSGGKPMVNHGVKFQDTQPNDSVILQSLIYQQMIEQPNSLA